MDRGSKALGNTSNSVEGSGHRGAMQCIKNENCLVNVTRTKLYTHQQFYRVLYCYTITTESVSFDL